MKRWTLMLLAIGILIAPLGVSVTHAGHYLEMVAHDELTKLGYQWVWGDPHCHSQFSDGKEKPSVLLELAASKQDFCFLTDHAEQLSAEEVDALRVLTDSFQRSGRLAAFGHEWTGTPDYLDPQGHHTKDPAEITGPGHMLVYDSEVVVRQTNKSGDQPTNILPTFPGFLDWVGRAPGMPLVAFAHPSLYRVEETFDRDGDGQGFDPPPADSAIVDRVFGCELSSHTYRTKAVKLPFPGSPPVDVKVEGYRGCGDGKDLASSNEAGYRELLWGGWRVSPLMSTDWHLPHYAAGPYTAVAVKERSVEGVLDGFYERLTCATEVHGLSLALVTWQQDARLRQIGGIVPMGSEMLVSPDAAAVWFAYSLRDKQGRPVQAKRLGAVLLMSSPQRTVGGSLKEWSQVPSELRRSEVVEDEHGGHLFYAKAVCVYAKATLDNGKQLISAPVFFRY